jgi:hypothetical protein
LVGWDTLWHKLEQLADEAARKEARPISVSELAAAILQHYVTGRP